jgi:hypothetical protein
MIKRILADIFLFAGLFFAPWYWMVILAVIFMILFRRYWEGVVAAFFLDALYSVPNSGLYGHFGIFTAVALILLFILETFKKKIRFFA